MKARTGRAGSDGPAENGTGQMRAWLRGNIVPITFLLFTLMGFAVSEDITLYFFLHDLSSRFFRNIFLVLSLIIPVIAGLGLNFGIVIGAMAGQIAIAIVRFFHLGGLSGLLLCAVISVPVAILFGWLTGNLYNRTRGQEMIASLIVGFFANGFYQFLFLYVVGGLVRVNPTHYMIKPDGVGVRATVDMGSRVDGGLQYALNGILRAPLIWVLLAGSLLAVEYTVRKMGRRNSREPTSRGDRFAAYAQLSGALTLALLCAMAIITGSHLMRLSIPIVTTAIIVLLCIFTQWIITTKLGQDFRSVGHSQHVSDVSGIDVDSKRILAVEISTVLAALGQIVYLQDMGTFNTYAAHSQIGMFSVAALLVGGASISRANIRHAIVGTILFNSMFIMSPEVGRAIFGQVLLGEYFRTFMVYGVIGVALGVYVWETNRRKGGTTT